MTSGQFGSESVLSFRSAAIVYFDIAQPAGSTRNSAAAIYLMGHHSKTTMEDAVMQRPGKFQHCTPASGRGVRVPDTLDGSGQVRRSSCDE